MGLLRGSGIYNGEMQLGRTQRHWIHMSAIAMTQIFIMIADRASCCQVELLVGQDGTGHGAKRFFFDIGFWARPV